MIRDNRSPAPSVHPTSLTNAIFSAAYSLLPLLLRHPSFVFNSLQPLFQKHPGGVHLAFSRRFCVPRLSPVTSPALLASPSVSHYCKLFSAVRNAKSCVINQIQTLATKHPGYGYHLALATRGSVSIFVLRLSIFVFRFFPYFEFRFSYFGLL